MASVRPTDSSGLVGDQPFLLFLGSLPEKPPTTFRFFSRNDFYTLHGSDAEFACKELFKTMAVMKYLGAGSDKVASVCLSQLNFESLVKDLLLVRHYRVEIYKNTSSGWLLDRKASPGNLTQLENVLFSEGSGLAESKGVLAVNIKSTDRGQLVGIAYADAILQEMKVAEFLDEESYCNLQVIFTLLGPKECLISSGDAKKYSFLKEVIERNRILVTEIKIGNYTTKDIVQDFNRLLKFKPENQGTASSLPEMDLKVALEGLSAVIKYLELLSCEDNFNQFSLTTFDFKQYVKVDLSAVRALGITPASSKERSDQSLLGILNRARTPGGQRLVAQWVRQPLMDIQKIEERLNIVEAFKTNAELIRNLHDDFLRRIPDLSRFSKKFKQEKATLEDCYRVHQFIQILPEIRKTLAQVNENFLPFIREMFIEPLKNSEEDFSNFLGLVETTVDLSMAQQGDFLVRSDVDDDLKELRNQMNSLEEDMKSQLNKAAGDLKLEADKSIKLESSDQLGYYFRVTRKEEKVLRGKKNYITIDTKQNGVRFHTRELQNLNEKYLSLRQEYEDKQEAVLKTIIQVAAGYSEPMKELNDLISKLDALLGFAVAAENAPKPYIRPTLHEKGTGKISLQGIRHPCVEAQDGVWFIPNDIHFEKGSSSFFIVTGPNMGGKSTYIRSVALAILMAQIGSFVPCDSAEITIVDAVLTRIGASDKPLKGVSTFMAEMLESATILKSATENSLIVIDELGRGTSTYDGLGLAWAISEHLAKKVNAYCLFATHFHELTELADEVNYVKNLHVTALIESETLTLLYKVKPGICDKSFGIEVAELAHFPKHVVEYAKEKVKEFEDMQGIISTDNLETKSHKLGKEADVILHKFTEDARSILDESANDDTVKEKLKHLTTELKKSDNLYVKKYLETIQ